MYSLGTAAKEARVSKSAIYRAVKSGRLSANRTDSGDYSIEPSELCRWRDANVPAKRDETPPERPETAVLQAELAGLKQLNELLRAQLAAWQAQAERLALTAQAPATAPEAPATASQARPVIPGRTEEGAPRSPGARLRGFLFESDPVWRWWRRAG